MDTPSDQPDQLPSVSWFRTRQNRAVPATSAENVVVVKSNMGTVLVTVPESNVGEVHTFVAFACTCRAAMSFARPPLSVKSHVNTGLVDPTTVPLGTRACGVSGASVVSMVRTHEGWSESKAQKVNDVAPTVRSR